jgi:hypothetical protein
LLRDAHRPGGRVDLALGGLAWPGGVGRSHAVTRGRTKDYPVAKETYSRALSAKSQSSEIVLRCTA